MQSLEKILNKFCFLLAIIISLPAVWTLLHPGFFGVSDDLHVAWLYEMGRSLAAGQIPPRFVPDLSYGFGYPLFNFVFPLPFYIGEIFRLLGSSLVDSVKGVFFLSLPIGAFFMYKLLREYTSNLLALAGVALYCYAPYRATDIYVRGAIGEIWAFALLPLIAWSILKVTDSQQKKILYWVGVGSLAVGGLVLSHNIAAYMFAPYIVLLVLMRVISQKNFSIKKIWPVLLTAVGGFLVSIYFWLPALLDSRQVKYDTVFNFIDHFPTLKQLVTPYFGYGASVPGPYDGMSFFLGEGSLLMIVIALISLVIFWKKLTVNQRVLLIWAWLTITSAIFMMNYRSTIIWKTIPLLPYFQFPWRFLMMTTFAVPLLVIALPKTKYTNLLAILIICVAIVPAINDFKPQQFLNRFDDYYLNRYIPVPQASVAYQQTGEEYLRLPIATSQRPDHNYPIPSISQGKISDLVQINSLSTELNTSTDQPATLSYYKYFFPGWIAEIDGQQVPLLAGQPFGQITLQVPSGQHQISIYFTETLLKRILDIISILAILVSLFVVMSNNLLLKITQKYNINKR
ncbi:6-pyruvoyl-tetrahydropterin synthase-related protein [Patescibacteria group bacterium]|nr:6-pyruvoyl-tetrahydropterin synthase-related protein [Patescibacteria group bacterium]MCL5409620.1 6-pyruvoyl-tetrahydropterin synthase-related protein [Patescibacteria group bacterium]